MNPLAEILSSKMRAEIFRLLFGVSSQPLHMREIERRSAMPSGSVVQELRKLLRLGLVTSHRDGNRVCYEANKASPLYNEIRGLVRKTSGLADVLSDALTDDRIELAFVFGSVARGEEKAESDVDLMVIGDVGLRKITGLLSGVAERLGREINPHAFTRQEFVKRLKGREHFVANVMKSPKLFVVGGENGLAAMAG